jgi:hypothetical protein
MPDSALPDHTSHPTSNQVAPTASAPARRTGLLRRVASVLALGAVASLGAVVAPSSLAGAQAAGHVGGDAARPAARTATHARLAVRAKHWPSRHNTGPKRTRLPAYHGPCTITSPRTIVGVDATKRCDAILIRAPRVVIKRSILPRIDATAGRGASVTLIRDRIKGGQWNDGAVWGYNITAVRVNVTGGQHSFHCAGNCTVTDSWLHGQWNPDGQSFHNNAFISNGGRHMVVRHNRLACTPRLNSTDGGCTGDLSLFGDFDPISDVVVDHNLFMANTSSISYCLYGGHDRGKPYGDDPTHIRVTNNVFERGSNRRCGVYGAVTSFKSSNSTNVWRNNRWTSGDRVRP